MLYWMERNLGGSETLDSLGNMSKAEILRGIVTEKLTTAAQEILAVVERTVAGYEEEASGFRREIDRQRRQLEVLLQPRVKLEKRGQWLNELRVNNTTVTSGHKHRSFKLWNFILKTANFKFLCSLTNLHISEGMNLILKHIFMVTLTNRHTTSYTRFRELNQDSRFVHGPWLKLR